MLDFNHNDNANEATVQDQVGFYAVTYIVDGTEFTRTVLANSEYHAAVLLKRETGLMPVNKEDVVLISPLDAHASYNSNAQDQEYGSR